MSQACFLLIITVALQATKSLLLYRIQTAQTSIKLIRNKLIKNQWTIEKFCLYAILWQRYLKQIHSFINLNILLLQEQERKVQVEIHDMTANV